MARTLLCLSCAWPLAARAGGAAPAAWAVPVPAWVKVRPGAAVPTLDRVELLAARGECEGLQVLVHPPAESVTLSASSLRGPDRGLRLGVTLFREAFVPVRTPSNAQGAPGLWPDPLIPAELDGPEDRASTAERPLVFYGEVCVPASARSGRYEGAMTLRARGKAAVVVPVSVEVQPFEIPATSSLPNSFGLSLYSVARGHRLPPEQARPLLWAYARELLRHRLTPHGLTMDGGGGDELRPFLDGTALPSGARFTSLDARGPLEAWTRRFAGRAANAQRFFYAKDEPRPEDVPVVLRQAAEARAAGVPVLVTSPYDERLAPAADILAPNLNCFFPRPGPQTCGAVLTAGELRRRLRPRARVWWYQSCSSHGCAGADGTPLKPEVERAYSGWASYMVDHPATLNRAMGPLAFLAGVDGELYFDTAYAFSAKPDAWDDVYAFGGNGDGTLFYPGRPDRLGGATGQPIASLRLKHIRDGLEDYEMLRLLARGEPELARRCVERLVRSGYEIEPDPAVWDGVRRTAAAALSRRAVGRAGTRSR